MSTLYQARVNDCWITREGLPVYVQHGEPITVQSTPMVALAHGTICPATGWHADRESAVREAADHIEQIGRRLLDQAASLRREPHRAS